MYVNGKTKSYEVILPDKKKIRIWFIGKQIEVILKAYNIPYKEVSYK